MNGTETFIILIAKKYVWHFVSGFIGLSIIHSAIEGYCKDDTSKYCSTAKAIVNGLYASLLAGSVLGYFYDEVGLVFGVLAGTVVGYGTLQKMLKEKLK